MKLLGARYVVTAQRSEEWTNRIVVENSLLPATVIEFIKHQTSQDAVTVRNPNDPKGMRSYMVKLSAEQEKTAITNGFLIQHPLLGGGVPVLPLETKVTFEEIFAYGVTGRGGADLDLKPEVAAALSVSADLVRVAVVPDCAG